MPIDQNPFVNVILVLQLNLFFPVELGVCFSVWQGRFLLFHQVPVAARFVLVWVGIANDSVVAYSLFSTFFSTESLTDLLGNYNIWLGVWEG